MSRPRFQPCPDSPNCVSSRAPADDREHFAEPIDFTGDADEALAAVLEVLADAKRTEVRERDDRYVRAVATSAILRFKDDIEFEVDDAAKVIHYRSASRVGQSDLGVNRKRMQQLGALIEARLR
jgi:uncharacterized protein (DUF1499 family)